MTIASYISTKNPACPILQTETHAVKGENLIVDSILPECQPEVGISTMGTTASAWNRAGVEMGRFFGVA